METPDLFDVQEVRYAAQGEESSPAPDWAEVPQARFLSWSEGMQLAYCARRDRDAAVREQNPVWREFYEERARGYEQLALQS